MPERNFWLDLFTGKTWQEFINAGANITGFRENRWKMVSQIKKGGNCSDSVSFGLSSCENFYNNERKWRTARKEINI